MGGMRRASVFASMRSIVSPCSATTAVKRWNMPPSSARVDFIAMSCYGRGTLRRYSVGTAALCSERLQRMRKLGVSARALL